MNRTKTMKADIHPDYHTALGAMTHLGDTFMPNPAASAAVYVMNRI